MLLLDFFSMDYVTTEDRFVRHGDNHIETERSKLISGASAGIEGIYKRPVADPSWDIQGVEQARRCICDLMKFLGSERK
jgi:hypothetical protein